MKRTHVDVFDQLEGLPPATGEFRTPSTVSLAAMRARRVRVGWYAFSVAAGIVSAFVTEIAYRRTGAYYPFISGFAMVTAVAGGFGPTLIASIGGLLLAHLIPPVGAMIPSTESDAVRLGANALLLVVGSVLAGLFRRSRLATFERESRLERATAAVRELLDGSSDGMVLTDSEFRITFVNARAEAMSGFRSADIIGRSVASIITPESLAKTPLQVQALREGRSVRSERTAFRADGSTIDVDISARFLSGGRLLASIRDASERKREFERQRSERDLLDGILATSVAAVIVVDEQDEIIFANQRAESLLTLTKSSAGAAAYDRPNIRRLRLDGVTPLADEERALRRVLDSGAPVFDVRFVVEWPSGRRVAVSVNGAPLRDSEGRLQAVVMALNDITAALDVDHALRERDRRLEQITEAMPGMVYQYLMRADGSEQFLYVSRYAARLTGASPESILRDATVAWSLIHPDDVDGVQQSVALSARTMSPWIREFRLRDPDSPGAWRWLSGRALPQPGAEHGSVLWNGIFLDITDRKMLEDDLRQAQRIESVGRLAGAIAHDFNNLLTVIVAQSELLSLDMSPDDLAAEGVAQIRAAAESGTALTRQLLGFARKQIVAPKVVDVSVLVQRLPTLVGRLLGEGYELRLAPSPTSARVRIDPAQLDQVLMNLAVNARDAMPGGGYITLRTQRRHVSELPRALAQFTTGEVAEISVHDHGVGMTAEVRERAFEPFFTTKGMGKGTGLGLATSYQIISQAGGTMLIESEPGQGTTIRMFLPVTEEPSTPVARALPVGDLSGSETLLVVDDDPAVRGVTALALRRQGYSVLEAESGEDAIRQSRAQSAPFHLLVTDVVMPGMSGPELAERLLREHPQLRVLYVSGYAEGAIAHHGVLDEGVALLQKPFDIVELARRVRELLGTLPN